MAGGIDPLKSSLRMIPFESINSILLVGKDPEVLKELDHWIKTFDRKAAESSKQMFVYKVKNSTASTLAQILGQLYDENINQNSNRPTTRPNNRSNSGTGVRPLNNRTTTTKRNTKNLKNSNSSNDLDQQTKQFAPQSNNPLGGFFGNSNQSGFNNQNGNNGFGNNNNQNGFGNSISGLNGNSGFNSPLVNGFYIGDSRVVVDESSNSLIFNATPKEFRNIERMLKHIDISPRQLFLEVKIIDVDLKDNYSLGFDWSGGDPSTMDDSSTGFLGGSINSGESAGLLFNYARIFSNTHITAKLAASLDNKNSRLLSQPHIMMVDNVPATINIVDQVPIVQQSRDINNETVTTSDRVSYTSIGIQLSILAHINDSGQVRLEIQQSDSSNISAANAAFPTIKNRSWNTQLIIKDGESVVMGGLISQQTSDENKGVPGLSKIPLLGRLFSKTDKVDIRSELIVLITPHVIRNAEDASRITNDFKKSLKAIID